ncbi:preprotein translocase subunit SecD [Candidatus Paracaedimonas acanthamoebae]|nr:preprotein translocase subunit SecD [Candidatus Paracaedimonas acanthamoebae]
MLTFARWKVLTSLILCLLGLIYAFPNFVSEEKLKKIPSWLPHERVNLGLDLQGGSHLLLEVDVKAGLKERLSFVLDNLRKTLRTEKIGYLDLSLDSTEDIITFQLRDQSQAEKISTIIKKQDPDLEVKLEGKICKITFTRASIAERQRSIVDQSIEIVRRRIDELGTKEPSIQRQGDDRVLIQIPGLSDPGRVKNLLGKTAKMTFRLLHDEHPYASNQKDVSPPGTEILPNDDVRQDGKAIFYVVRKENLLGGESLVDAGVSFDEYHRPQVSFRFDNLGAKKFGDITSKNIHRQLAIVLDGKVISAPTIQTPITGGNGVITGKFTVQEANDLALLMRAGALVAPLVVLEERTVGPDLGADSIASGRYATMLSVVMVAVFMLIAYSLFGFFANAAMLFNLILTVAVLSLIGATLTLPGIAGIALTMGMAVDANVLINERIKEELRHGRKMLSAIDVGYRQAMNTILDSNLTTLIGAAALFLFGTGPVKGFGITLAIGILISMFTAIILTRVFVTYWVNWSKPTKLPI